VSELANITVVGTQTTMCSTGGTTKILE